MSTSSSHNPPAPNHNQAASRDKPAPPPLLRDSTPADRPWLNDTITREFASTLISSARRLIDTTTLPALIAVDAQNPADRLGLAALRHDGDEMELVALVACRQGRGIGTALLGASIERARALNLRRLFLTMSNDNLPAFAFYQHRGLHLCKLHVGAMTEARLHIPQLPLIGHAGIEMRDDLEFEILLR